MWNTFDNPTVTRRAPHEAPSQDTTGNAHRKDVNVHTQPLATRSDRRIRQRRRLVPRRNADVPWIAAPRVLFIAPEVQTRLIYTSLLEEAGYAVYAVADEIEALQTITRRLPDVVIVGPQSAGARGLALVKALRAERSTSDVPAVVLAAVQLQADPAGRNRHTGTTLLLGEPVSGHAVLTAVDDLTRATPPERFLHRQLRRALLTLGTLEATSGDPGERIEQMCAVIGRVHAAIVGIDPHGGLLAASRGAEALTGYTRAELTAKTVFDSALGADLPLAAVWQKHTGGRSGELGPVALRDKAGRAMRVEVEARTLLPELTAIAFAASP